MQSEKKQKMVKTSPVRCDVNNAFYFSLLTSNGAPHTNTASHPASAAAFTPAKRPSDDADKAAADPSPTTSTLQKGFISCSVAAVAVATLEMIVWIFVENKRVIGKRRRLER